MPLPAGSRFGPYEILAPLGAGGMGEVYRARDTRLNRTVALKVLAPAVAANRDLRARFDREARAIAALSHPHICTVHDVGEQAGTAFLVMELLDGQTLASRLEHGALPLAQALTVAREIAGALDRAHRNGIVHRDLKPANVMLTKSGAKLLDFGLAKLRPTAGAVAISGAAPTATTAPDTAAGTILGTIHYMAPEQVEGKDADSRADLWALGAVLYEMLTGVRPFTGDTPASVMSAILKDTPAPLSQRQPMSPRALDEVVAGCLVKDVDDRWQSAADVKRQLEGIAKQTGDPVAGISTGHARPPWLGWALLGIAALAAAVIWRSTGREPTAGGADRVVRFQLTLPAGLTLVPEQPPAVSPDGLRFALVAIDRESGRRQIYVRQLNSVAAQAVSGTLDAQYPFWSSDGRKLAFFAGTRLRTIELESGASQDLAPAPNPGGPGVWTGDDIVYSRSTGPVVRVSQGGGSPRNAAPFHAARETNQSLVGVLPDGRSLVSSQAGLFVVTATGDSSTLLTDTITMPATLLEVSRAAGVARLAVAFLQNGRLMAQTLNADATALAVDPPVILASEASRLVTQSALPFSAGADVLAFTSRSDIQTRPTWVTRQGVQVGPATSASGQIRDIRLSPNGRMLSFSRLSQESRFELMVVDLQRDTVSRLARQLSFQQASWTPDGLSLIGVGLQGTGARAIFTVPIDEGAQPQLILRPPDALPAVPRLSPDGKYLCYTRTDNTGDFDIYVRALEESGEGRPLVSDAPYEASCQISPDGRWVAYHSNESGVLNVFMRSFPDGREKQQVSLEGGQRPSWRSDGRELYYLAPDGGLVAAAVVTTPTLTIRARERLFTAPIDPTFGTPGAILFDAAPAGDRFVMLVPTSNLPQPVTVILNWRSLLSRQ